MIGYDYANVKHVYRLYFVPTAKPSFFKNEKRFNKENYEILKLALLRIYIIIVGFKLPSWDAIFDNVSV